MCDYSKIKSNILFWGELSPKTIHGIAIANQINITILGSFFSIDIIEEENRFNKHDNLSIQKFINSLGQFISIICKSISYRYSHFYLVFSLSTFGAIKTLLAISSFRLFNRGRVILHIHRGDFYSRFLKKRINKILTNLIFSMIYKVIVLSENQKKELLIAFNKPCEVLCNTVETEYPKNHKENLKQRFLFISNYLIDKGILDLLEVFKKLCVKYPNINLETYGAFSDQKLKETILSYNSSNIHIHETISGTEKFKKIANADCLILPSWNEGQPIVLLEAMSVGTPIIASKVGLIPELLGYDYPYFTNPKDQLSLENTIIRFMESESIDNISKELQNKYISLYSIKKHEERILKIFGKS